MAAEYKYTCVKCRSIWFSAKSVDHKCPKCGFTANKKETIKK